ncbi:hypothetical protein EG329_010590 [Mollisiaceae sp. DMI_Dod_QoI]|nr:hypothetical protein EG329_010590 [Helotiales sp. DMI_Dod_QoI]
MPGVIMDNGSRNGSHTNHDRDQRHNGINGGIHTSEKMQEKGKGRVEPQQNMTPISPTIPNGVNGNFSENSQLENGAENGLVHGGQDRMNQLPPEIAHITDGYMPLSLLLSRLVQQSHSGMLATVTEMAQMPLPASVLNGNASHTSSTDDNSPENVAKKKRLLDFVTTTHEAWTKALVITGWSRKSEEVSKTIDIRNHTKTEEILYLESIDRLAVKRRELIPARLSNPDLRTAVPVLTTGKAHWMPDLGYIPPAPLTAKEVLRSLEKLNTLLSMRLNLDDFDSIPPQFEKFSISSGRATFKVEGEFELDLTVADEDPQSQFWFIDFRFMFWPSAPTLAARIRNFIEIRVNEILLRDGLSGCYKYLHELILTYKISEFKRQAVDLARAKRAETLKVEGLNRALSVQYWVGRYNGLGAKSWVILGVHSGKREDGRADPKSTSHLFLRWFRDHKEIKDVEIPFDTVNVSMEALLKVVIAKHISHILTAIFDKLRTHPLYANKELSLSLATPADEPELKVQLTNERELCVKIDPISGRFVFSPTILLVHKSELALNAPSKDPKDPTGKRIEDPIDKGLRVIENLRYQFIIDDIATRGVTFGWMGLPDPGIKRSVLSESIPKNTQRYMWLRRPGWVRDWYLLVCLSMSGVNWLLIKLAKQPTALDPNPNALIVSACLKVPIKPVSPTIDYTFLSTLNVFTAGVLSHYSNLKTLYARRARHMLRQGKPSKSLSLPSIFIRLTELLPQSASMKSKAPWAKDVIKLTFQGVEVHMPNPDDHSTPPQTSVNATQSASTGLIQRHSSLDENAVLITEARMMVPLRKDLANLNEKVDPDIAYNPTTGSFAFRLRSKIGESVVPNLVERIFSIERLVHFVQVLQKHEKTLKCETVSLGKIVFRYGDLSSAPAAADSTTRQLPLYRATVDFSTAENKMILILEKGNPHLRIMDYLANVLNTTEGLNGVATLLTLTLPILRGLNAIEDAWNDTALCEKGEVFVNVRAADWYIIRYNLKQGAGAPQRKVMFEVRLRQRRRDPWWYIHRTDNSRSKEVDNLDNAFKSLWSSSGEGWRGMRVSGVAQGSGAEELLVKMDEVMRTFAMSDTTIVQEATEVPAPAPSQKQAPTQAPPSRQQQQQPRQQPTPNQSQSQSQGRSNPVKREIVEID